MNASGNSNGEFKGTVKEAIATLKDCVKDLRGSIADFDTRMDLRFEKFGESLERNLKENYVSKIWFADWIRKNITGSPIDNRKMKWVIAGILVSSAIGIVGILLNFFGGKH